MIKFLTSYDGVHILLKDRSEVCNYSYLNDIISETEAIGNTQIITLLICSIIGDFQCLLQKSCAIKEEQKK